MKFSQPVASLEVTMLNILGQEVVKQKVSHPNQKQTMRFSVSNLNAGIYYYRISADGIVRTLSFVKQ